MSLFRGTGVALVTPFKKDLSIDTIALRNIVDYAIEGEVEYLVVLGTTAESSTLGHDEKKLVIETVVEANKGKLPLVLGVGGNHTYQLVEELKTGDFSKFSAILSVCPYYNKPTQEGIYQHFRAVAEASPLPVILYNVPGRTATNILPETVLKLAYDFKNIVGIKEAAGDMVQAMRLIQHKPKDFFVISGDDMIALPMVLAGGSGVISVIGQAFPKHFSSMIRLGIEGKAAEAYKLYYQLMDGVDMIFEQGNPAGIKAVFSILNLSENVLRLPLVNVNEDLAVRIKEFVKKIVD